MAQASTFQVLFEVGELAIGLAGLFIAGWSLHLSRVRARTERTATVETVMVIESQRTRTRPILGDHADIEARARLDGADAEDAVALPAGDSEDGLPDLEMANLLSL